MPEGISKLKIQNYVLRIRHSLGFEKMFCCLKTTEECSKNTESQLLKLQISGVPPWEFVIQVGLGQDLEIMFQYSQVILIHSFKKYFLHSYLVCARTILSAGDTSLKRLQNSQEKSQ